MHPQSACNSAVRDTDRQGSGGKSLSDVSGGGFGTAAYDDAGPAPRSSAHRSATDRVLDYLPPLTVGAVVCFWWLGPASLTGHPWAIVVSGALVAAFIQGLEFVHERHAGWRIDRREFLTDIFYMLLMYTAIAWVTAALADEPLSALKERLGITTEWALAMPFLLQVALVIFLIEFGQYWMHRLMHNSTPFWLTHAPHHHITQLNAMKGAVGNPIELFLISLSVVALFDIRDTALFCAINVLGVISTYAHANVRSDPPPFYAFFFTTIRHHSLHHSVGYEETRCNYANSLIVLDRVFGTYRDGESAIVGQDERKRLSIREQFLFPFVPAFEWLKAKRNKPDSASG
jgi:sterol desaturase/sphingolipid hydroxylase (fatty acid hydroxylase superfamily)